MTRQIPMDPVWPEEMPRDQFPIRLLFHAGTLRVVRPCETNKPLMPSVSRLPGCWEMAHAFLQEAPVPLSLPVGLLSPSLPRAHPCLGPSPLLCSLPARALAAIPELDRAPRPQLCPRISLYSSGTRSGSTGLGKKCVNFWWRLDLVPSLGVPSLFNATK